MKIEMNFIDSLKQDYVAKTREVNVYSRHIDFIHLKCIFYFFSLLFSGLYICHAIFLVVLSEML